MIEIMKKIFFLFIAFASYKSFSQRSNANYPDDFFSKPVLQWTYQTGGPVFSSPVADDGIVYFGSLDSNLYALEATSGRLKWKLKTGGEIRSAVAIDAETVYAVSGDGCIYAIQKKDHQLKWKFGGHGDRKYELFSFADYFQSSPYLLGDSIFYGAGDYVFAVDKNSGKEIWEYKTGSVVHSSPTVYNHKLFVGSLDGYFYALDTKDGSLKWKFKSVGQRYFPRGEMQDSPTAYDGMIFTGSRDYNFYALDAEKGFGLWNKQFARGWAMTKPVVRDSVLYIGTSEDRVIVALDSYTGRILWQTNVKFNVFGSFTFSKSMLYAGTLMGRLYALDIKTGNIIWSMNSDLFDQNRNKYFKDDENYRDDITSVFQKNEDVLKMYYDLGAIFSQPLIYNNQLFVTSLDGKIYSYHR